MSGERLTSQFSLGFELTQVAPLQTTLDLAAAGSLALARRFQIGGSDLWTENAFAETMGRALVEPAFASTFRNAVRASSAVHRIAGIVELVLEAGAAQSVRFALDKGHVRFFSALVQISMLTWAVELRSLARVLERALAQAFVRNPEETPQYDNILGVLRCYREQTCGFMWELQFEAVEFVLEGSLGYKGHRAPSPAVLSSLLHVLPKIQRYPEEYVLELRLAGGISTVVVWIHKLLGLNVVVKHQNQTWIADSNASVMVYIEATKGSAEDREFTLMSRDREILWSTSFDAALDTHLDPASRHTILNFGSKMLRLTVLERRVSGSHAECERPRVVSFGRGALSFIRNDTILASQLQGWSIASRVTNALNILFEGTLNGQSIQAQELLSSEASTRPTSSGGNVKFPDILNDHQQEPIESEPIEHLSNVETVHIDDKITEPDLASHTRNAVDNNGSISQSIEKSLTYLIVIMATITDLEAAQEAYLSFDYSLFVYNLNAVLESKSQGMQKIYDGLRILITGESFLDTPAAIVSRWGWSIILSSVHAKDPRHMHSTIDLVKGVPSRNGDRRRAVLDPSFVQTGPLNVEEFYYRITGSPGDRLNIECQMLSQPFESLIGSSDDAFVVARKISVKDNKTGRASWSRLGYYRMQMLYWESTVLSDCQCEKLPRGDEQIQLPARAWAFDGLCHGADSGRIDPDPWEIGPSDRHSTKVFTGMLAKQMGQDNFEHWRRARIASGAGRDSEARVHISRSSGNSSMRWLVLSDVALSKSSHSLRRFQDWSVLPQGCCPDCGVKQMKSLIKGNGLYDCHAVLVT